MNTRFYVFHQNNSGGAFKGDAIHVIIEANNEYQANALASGTEVYFDGREKGVDCECCGDRWSRVWGDYDAFSLEGALRECGNSESVRVYFLNGMAEHGFREPLMEKFGFKMPQD